MCVCECGFAYVCLLACICVNECVCDCVHEFLHEERIDAMMTD